MNESDTVDKLFAELGNQDIKERSKAIDVLASMGNKEILNHLISSLRKNSPRIVREGACKALGKIGNPKAADSLILALDDSEESVRYQATIALGQIGDTKAVNPLLTILKRKDDPLVRSEAAKALGLIGDPSALKILLNILKKEDDRFIKYHVVTSLGRIGEPKAKKALEKIIKNESDDRLVLRSREAIEKINQNNIVAG
ncbi:MAG: HEAT repeat domain-containing protein [Candidatus Heimdallarchaeota archaeon]